MATSTELSGWRSSYTTLVSAGKKAFPEARILFGNIIRGFNDLNDRQGLQSFLISENDDAARKLLIPLYIEQGVYATALSTINTLTVSQAEKSAYSSYYNVLIGIKQQNRQINTLTQQEMSTVQAIANADFEVTPYAKGLLEYAYGMAWSHPVDVGSQQSQVAQAAAVVAGNVATSYLSHASPNPATDRVSFVAWVTDEDDKSGAEFVIKSITGQILLKRALKAGENKIRVETAAALQPGLYIYSLVSANRVLDSKKLSVIR